MPPQEREWQHGHGQRSAGADADAAGQSHRFRLPAALLASWLRLWSPARSNANGSMDMGSAAQALTQTLLANPIVSRYLQPDADTMWNATPTTRTFVLDTLRVSVATILNHIASQQAAQTQPLQPQVQLFSYTLLLRSHSLVAHLQGVQHVSAATNLNYVTSQQAAQTQSLRLQVRMLSCKLLVSMHDMRHDGHNPVPQLFPAGCPEQLNALNASIPLNTSALQAGAPGAGAATCGSWSSAFMTCLVALQVHRANHIASLLGSLGRTFPVCLLNSRQSAHC